MLKSATPDQKFKLLSAMNEIIYSMNNEEAYCSWIYLIPDQADSEDLWDIASDEDEEIFNDACAKFSRLVSIYGNDGYFVGGTKAYGCKEEE